MGNLLLVTEELNNELEDASFAEKKKLLKTVPGIESEIAGASAWGSSEILDRSKRMAKLAYEETWKF